MLWSNIGPVLGRSRKTWSQTPDKNTSYIVWYLGPTIVIFMLNRQVKRRARLESGGGATCCWGLRSHPPARLGVPVRRRLQSPPHSLSSLNPMQTSTGYRYVNVDWRNEPLAWCRQYLSCKSICLWHFHFVWNPLFINLINMQDQIYCSRAWSAVPAADTHSSRPPLTKNKQDESNVKFIINISLVFTWCKIRFRLEA